MGKQDAGGLNKELREQAYLGGAAQPSEKDREAVDELFGGDMKVLNWAARMATLYPNERRAMGQVAAAAAPGKEKKEKKEKDQPAKKPETVKSNAFRTIGGGEGLVDGSPIETLMTRNLDWPAAKVRQSFVDFFVQEKKLPFVPSSPTVPRDDKTLLFANAGMNQFKSIFLGTVSPNSDMAKLKGACNSQKCIRAGGKHNDLDDVGKDTYHHTFFEMLGNWSFGDYFKEESIAWSWHLLTAVYKLPKDRLYATYFEGNKSLGLEPDFESKKIWQKYLPDNQILPGNMADNFWEMGDIGPCGPCTEIHYDRIGGRNAAHLVNMDDPMVLELWNLVFMTHMRTEKGLQELPAKHVDTGMGLERITSVLQGVYSNYDTDAWWKMFETIKEISQYEHSYHSKGCPEDAVIAYRVVADHIRTVTVSLTDGGVPDNNGRGYVIRRIIRRAVRYGKEFLGAPLGFFSQLVKVVAADLGCFFPELKDEQNIKRTTALILEEEEAFDKTWKVGLKHFEDALANARKEKKNLISGKDAFILHDRYGFPCDLTIIMAEKAKCKEPFVDLKEFHQMAEAAKGGQAGAKLNQYLSVNNIDILTKQGVAPTVDTQKYVWNKPGTAKVVGILDKPSDKIVDSITTMEAPKPDPKKKDAKKVDPTQEHAGIILDQTTFYYESGGQIYDTGLIKAKDGSFTLRVNKVLIMGPYIAHVCKVESGTVKVGAEVVLEVDYERRLNVGANHTGTHQLNHELREVLEFKEGNFTKVNQRGSLVEEGQMRFDFSWNEKLTSKEIQDVEDLMNKAAKKDAKETTVYSQVVPLEEARQINGLRQMFDEKYPDPVRVVSIGVPVDTLLKNPSNPDWLKYSIEFCGGTHLESLKDMEDVAIVAEEALMKGIRRMVVLTREPARQAFAKMAQFEKDLKAIAENKSLAFDDKIKTLQKLSKEIGDTTLPIVKKNAIQAEIGDNVKALHAEKKKVAEKAKKDANALGVQMGDEAKASGAASIVKSVPNWGADSAALTEVCSGITKQKPDCLVFVTAAKDGKGLAIATVPKGTKDKSAADWVKKACGRGGGNAEKAQTGFAPADEEKVLKAAAEWLQ